MTASDADDKACKAFCCQFECAVIDIVKGNDGFFAVKVKFDAKGIGLVFGSNRDLRAADAEKTVFCGNFKRDGFFFVVA